MYFNKDLSLLMCQGTFFKAYLFKKIPLDGGRCRWQIVKRVPNFREDMSLDSKFLYFYSPCFNYYIDADMRENKFKIKDTHTD